MQLFKTELIPFHPPQHPGAYRSRRSRLSYGDRRTPSRGSARGLSADQTEDLGFPAPETVIVDDDPPTMDRAA